MRAVAVRVRPPFGGGLRAHLPQERLDLLLPGAMAPFTGRQCPLFVRLGNFREMGQGAAHQLIEHDDDSAQIFRQAPAAMLGRGRGRLHKPLLRRLQQKLRTLGARLSRAGPASQQALLHVDIALMN